MRRVPLEPRSKSLLVEYRRGIQPVAASHRLTSGRLLFKNALWNLMGQVLPLVVAVFAIPSLIQGLGTERFGLLSLMWVVIGYASLFDLGLGRALTQMVAKKIGEGDERDIPPVASTALWAMSAIGVLGGVVLAMGSPAMVASLQTLPPASRTETLNSLYLLAASLPVVIVTTGLRGLLEAYQKFGWVNVVRIPLGVFNFIGPLMVLPFANDLSLIVAALVVARVVACGAYWLLCLKHAPARSLTSGVRRKFLKPLLTFGGWMTVSNIIGPIMVYLDRFLIAGMLSVTAVAYYTTPYEAITKLLIIPVGIMAVLFPALGTELARNVGRVKRLYGRCMLLLLVLLLPVTVICILYARVGLSIWLNPDFGTHSTLVAQWLMVGVLMNSLAQPPFALVQAAGRPDLTAKLHMVELPVYLLCLWFLLRQYGIAGVAAAWSLRTGADMLLLHWMAGRVLRNGGKRTRAAFA